MIRTLRLARRLSQEELAFRARVSTRHLSCLENGRAHPSHMMVLALGQALDLPLRERNTLLIAAGFAPVYRSSPLQDPAMQHVEQALTRIMTFHEPHPAVLLDRSWNVLRLNAGAVWLFQWCGIMPSAAAPAGKPINAHRLLFDPAGLRPWVVNFAMVADAVLQRMATEVDVDPSARALLEELKELRGEPAEAPEAPKPPVAPNLVALPIHLRRDGQDLRYFSTLTTLGTPLDVTAQELRIESFFPMDEATERFGHARVGAG
jgi:transcriptional regulator with XRE-family HTH domain